MRQLFILYCRILIVSTLFSACKSASTAHVLETEVVSLYKQKENQYIKVWYHKNSNKKLNGNYSYCNNGFRTVGRYKNGLLIGMQKIFRKDTLIEVLSYNNGIKDGKQMRLAVGDSIQYNFSRGIQHGPEIHFKNGKAVRSCEFEDGIKTGEEAYFNNQGEKTASVIYSRIAPNDYNQYTTTVENVKARLNEGNAYREFEIIGLANHDSISIELLTSVYKYEGEIEINGSINLDAYNTSHNEFSAPDLGLFGISCKAVSESLWSTLADPRYKLYGGLFYIVTVNVSEIDTVKKQQWIILLSIDAPENLALIKIK